MVVITQKSPIFTLYITLKKYAKIRLIYTFINLHVKFYLKVTTTQYKTEKDIIKSIKEFEKKTNDKSGNKKLYLIKDSVVKNLYL